MYDHVLQLFVSCERRTAICTRVRCLYFVRNICQLGGLEEQQASFASRLKERLITPHPTRPTKPALLSTNHTASIHPLKASSSPQSDRVRRERLLALFLGGLALGAPDSPIDVGARTRLDPPCQSLRRSCNTNNRFTLSKQNV